MSSRNRPWRLLVDGTHLGPQAKGVGLYTQNVLARLLAMDDALEMDVIVLSREAQVDLGTQGDRLRWHSIRWRNHLWHGFRELPRRSFEHRPDVVWMPYETPIGRLGVPFLMVCHDIPSALRQAQELGGGKAPAWRSWQHRLDDWLLGKTLRRAEVLFSNSRWVGEGLAREFNLDPDRLQLAPCAPAVDFEALSHGIERASVRRRLELDAGYLLTFHTGDPRENHAVIAPTFDRLVNSGSAIGLVVAGLRAERWGAAEDLYRSYPWYDRVRFMPFLGAEQKLQLAELYAAASIYLDPSLQEGFGMQVIEAMACGTPVVCSDRSALPEVTGDAALLVDPQDVAAIADTLKNLLDNPRQQDQLAERGRRRARGFQWRHTAEVIRRALRAAIEPRGRTDE